MLGCNWYLATRANVGKRPADVPEAGEEPPALQPEAAPDASDDIYSIPENWKPKRGTKTLNLDRGERMKLHLDSFLFMQIEQYCNNDIRAELKARITTRRSRQGLRQKTKPDLIRLLVKQIRDKGL